MDAEKSHYQPVNQGAPLASYTDPGSHDPPPAYESLFSRIIAARYSTDSKLGCVKSILGIFLGTLGCTICLGIFLIIPIAMIIVGALYLHECPAQRFIPIYLVVAGSFGLVKNLSSLVQKVKNDKDQKREQDEEDKNAKTNPFDMILNCFLFAWFIAGNVWVYRTTDWVAEPTTAANYCHPTCYYFAFWIMTSTYILIVAICCCTLIGGCCVVACFGY